MAGNYPLFVRSPVLMKNPQNRRQVVKALKDAGVIVCRSNAEASKLCKRIIKKLATDEHVHTDEHG